MKILLIGPPACGKGTVGDLLSKKLSIPLISVGQLLRNIPVESKHYQSVHERMDKGDLVDSSIAAEVLKDRLTEQDCSKGYILDGWGRKYEDIQRYDPKFDLVIFLNISEETVVKRVSGRRICKETGQIFNIYTMSPEEAKTCPSELIQRDDDKEEVVRERLIVYKEQTVPVIEYFRSVGNLVEVDAEPSPDEIFKNVCKALNIS